MTLKGMACRVVVRSIYEKLCIVARLRFTSTRQPSFSAAKRLACRVVARSAFGESSFQPAYALRATAWQSSLFVVMGWLAEP
jgi:hypothetical protein